MDKIAEAESEQGQNPHAVREPKENNLEQAIGREVRTLRKALGLTVSDIAGATGLSVGMLSKIENGNTSPSLTTLQALARALGRAGHHAVPAFRGAAWRSLRQGRRGRRAGAARHAGRASVQSARPYRLERERGASRALPDHPDHRDPDIFPTFQHEGSNSSTCSRARSCTATATSSFPCSPATACSSTPMRHTGRKAGAPARALSVDHQLPAPVAVWVKPPRSWRRILPRNFYSP